MFQRLALKALQQWVDKEERKPLVLGGARQVGKTTQVELFSRNFDVFINLNLEEKEIHDCRRTARSCKRLCQKKRLGESE